MASPPQRTSPRSLPTLFAEHALAPATPVIRPLLGSLGWLGCLLAPQVLWKAWHAPPPAKLALRTKSVSKSWPSRSLARQGSVRSSSADQVSREGADGVRVHWQSVRRSGLAAHSFGVLVPDRLPRVTDQRRIVSGSQFRDGSVSFGGRCGQFQSDSCRPGPQTDPGVIPKLTMSSSETVPDHVPKLRPETQNRN